MGEGDKRQSRRVVRYDSRELARVTQRPGPRDDEAADDKAAPKDAAAALISRTATLDDPLTTVLLAEASRRAMTTEVSADQIAEVKVIVAGASQDDDE